MKDNQKKVVLINQNILEILFTFLMLCYGVLDFALKFNLGRGNSVFYFVMIVLFLVLFIVRLINDLWKNRNKVGKPLPPVDQKQFSLSSIFLILSSFMVLLQTMIQNKFKFSVELILSFIALSAIFLIISINIHHQNELWKQERIDSESFVEE